MARKLSSDILKPKRSVLGQLRAGSTEQGILVTAVARCLRVGWPPVLKLVRLPAVADEKHGSAVRDSDGVKPASVQISEP
jgi:hypothetical protein